MFAPKLTAVPEVVPILFTDTVPVTDTESFILITVESVERIVLPEISIVPKVCVPPEPVILVPVIAPVSYTHLTLPTNREV